MVLEDGVEKKVEKGGMGIGTEREGRRGISGTSGMSLTSVKLNIHMALSKGRRVGLHSRIVDGE